MVDRLASWQAGPIKSAILTFVERVTTVGSAEFVPENERIAVFDNDGTLWCEHPLQPQVVFAQDRLRALCDADPTLGERQPFKALIEHDLKTIHTLGKQAIFEAAFMTHAGMTQAEFRVIARAWLASARHPKLGRLFTHCVFQPQIELLKHLRMNGFKTFIVSGGGIDFIRAFAEEAYGVPPEQVIGSSVKTHVETKGGAMEIVKAAELNSFDDREAKVENIALHIGRRPIFAFGNSDGDLAMLRYTKTGPGPSLALLLHHDDEEREVAYDRAFKLSPLVEALDRAGDYGIDVVSMKRDWAAVFPRVTAEPSVAA